MSSSAQRKRAERERRRQGAIVIPPLACPPSAIEAMIDAGDLPAWDANNKEAVRAAIERHLARLQSVTT